MIAVRIAFEMETLLERFKPVEGECVPTAQITCEEFGRGRVVHKLTKGAKVDGACPLEDAQKSAQLIRLGVASCFEPFGHLRSISRSAAGVVPPVRWDIGLIMIGGGLREQADGGRAIGRGGT